jgi:hypothetical protein
VADLYCDPALYDLQDQQFDNKHRVCYLPLLLQRLFHHRSFSYLRSLTAYSGDRVLLSKEAMKGWLSSDLLDGDLLLPKFAFLYKVVMS